MEFDAVIGLEVHAQLRTATKLFCGCRADYGAGPNRQTCPVCLGLPGVLPVVNARAVDVRAAPRSGHGVDDRAPVGLRAQELLLSRPAEGLPDHAVRAADLRRRPARDPRRRPARARSASSASTSRRTPASRCTEPATDPPRPQPRRRAAARDRLAAGAAQRRGGPRLPDAPAAVAGLPGDLRRQPGGGEPALRRERVDPAARRHGARHADRDQESQFAARRVEGDRLRDRAADRRSSGGGGRVEQATYGWDATAGRTVFMRSKEEAHDYRYFPEPDLPPLVVTEEELAAVNATLPELPHAREARLAAQYDLPPADAARLADTRPLADYFEATAAALGDGRAAANWILDRGAEVRERARPRHRRLPGRPDRPGRPAGLVRDGTISGRIAKEVFAEMVETGVAAEAIIVAKGLRQQSDAGAARRRRGRGARRPPAAGGRLPRRPHEAVRLLRRRSDEGDRRPGEPGTGEQAPRGGARAAGLRPATKPAPHRPYRSLTKASVERASARRRLTPVRAGGVSAPSR